ncbi:MAG: cupin domain-containing protein [Prolixibacteraceae bacterium]
MESPCFVLDNETPVSDLGGGVSRQILGYNKDMMMVKVIFEKGAIGAVHAHVHTQTTYCAEGVFEFRVGEMTQVVKKGDGLYMPSGMLHGVVCLEEGILIDTFNPVREDFLASI